MNTTLSKVKTHPSGTVITVGTIECPTCRQRVKLTSCLTRIRNNTHFEAHKRQGDHRLCDHSGKQLTTCFVRCWVSDMGLEVTDVEAFEPGS